MHQPGYLPTRCRIDNESDVSGKLSEQFAGSNDGNVMKRSTDRFLTTHTGSLPRPEDLIRMMYAKEEGVPVDAGALSQRVSAAVADIVRRQFAAGIDIVND